MFCTLTTDCFIVKGWAEWRLFFLSLVLFDGYDDLQSPQSAG